MGRKILSGLLWATVAIWTLLFTPIVAVVYVCTAPFDPGHYAAGRLLRICAMLTVKTNPLWHFRTSGVRITDPRRPYVAVSNHESFADIFLISHLPWEMKWVSKETFFRLPAMGWMMRMAGDIEVQRGSTRGRLRALDGIRDRIAKRVTVMVMPEGTRSKTGNMLPFQDGAFRVAVETGAPILPMAVAGTRDAMAKGSLVFNRARAEVRVLEPVETAGLTVKDVPELRERVRAMIQAARDELRRELEDRSNGEPNAAEGGGEPSVRGARQRRREG
ncbi:MAG TPA: lysophospholipid acyltransferase family protein [Longimicrobiales bacterium]|nr:lysophospholipid acyltransferase family protein [Longimicrobiales bacterium]